MSTTSLDGPVNPRRRYTSTDLFSLYSNLSTTKRADQLAKTLFAAAPGVGTSIVVTLKSWRSNSHLVGEGIKLFVVTSWIGDYVAKEHQDPACELFFEDKAAAELAKAILSHPVDSGVDYVYKEDLGKWVKGTPV